jgi:hypothetical protein
MPKPWYAWNTKANKIKLLHLINSEIQDFEDEGVVYPLSLRYDHTKAMKNVRSKYLIIIVLMIILAVFLVASFMPTRSLPIRIGYFADKVTEDSFSLSGLSEIAVNSKNWAIYLLENTDSRDSVEIYVSAARGTDISFPKSGSVQSINIDSGDTTITWFARIKIPGGVSIPKLSFKYDGDSVEDLLLFDETDGDKWITPMIIVELTFSVNDAYPNIIFNHPHEVTTLTVTGSYWAWTFEKMKIKTMVFTVTVGSLNVVQNRVYAENKVTLKTPHGTHCVAGNTINTVDANWPSQATRDAGISGTFIDTSTYCTSELYVCSDSSTIACPGSGTAASATQGDFTITLNDGPVQLLIDGSANGATSTYAPTQDTFSISSQILLSDNKIDFSSDDKDSRIYIYEVISPGYTKLWTHSSLKQYIQARPW